MVLDINKFRTENGGNPEEIKKSELKRKGDPNVVDDVIKFDQEWRKHQFDAENKQAEIKKVQKAMGDKKKKDKTDPCDEEKAQVEALKKEKDGLEE